MIIFPISRKKAEYLGFGLRASFTQSQWQFRSPHHPANRRCSPKKKTVRGWDEDETMKRAKIRIDVMIENPSLS